MKASLKKLAEELGLSRVPSPYETIPYYFTEEKTGDSCNAEARLSGDGEVLEAEIQIVYAAPKPGKPPIEQKFWFTATPHVAGEHSITQLRIMGKDKYNSGHHWGEKGCKFFRLTIRAIMRGEMPDFDDIERESMYDGSFFGDQQGDGSARNPTIKMSQLLDIKKGRGF